MAKSATYYLVLDDYTCVPLGVADTEPQAFRMFPEQNVRVVGPVGPGPIDWETVEETRVGKDYGPISAYTPVPRRTFRKEYDKDYDPYAKARTAHRNPDGSFAPAA